MSTLHATLRRKPVSTYTPTPTVRWRNAEWSARSPDAPGLYHYREADEPGLMRLAHVRRAAGGVLVARFAHGEVPVANKSGEWAGPLTLTFAE